MSHTHHDKKKLLARVKRIKGQVEGLERMLEEEKDCYETLQAIAACRGAMNGLMSEVLEGHIRFHIVEEKKENFLEIKKAGEEIVSIVKSYLK